MATKVLMPQLGESVTEGTIAKWLVKPGDLVNKYDPLAEVATDKVNAEVPSTMTGKVVEIVVAEGETVAVGTHLLTIQEAGEESVEQQPATAVSMPVSVPAAAAAKPAVAEQTYALAVLQNRDGKKRYSPAVMHLAQEHGIDLERIVGTGAEGRITRKDVLLYIENGGVAKSQVPTPPPAAPVVQAVVDQPIVSVVKEDQTENRVLSGDQVIPVTPVRKTIASRMVQSKHEAPHAWMMVEVDATNLVNLRNQIKDEFKRNEGFNLTYLPFFIKAVVEALKEYPLLNSTWSMDSIILKKNINISIAVATEEALFVPVIKDADQKSLYGIARAVEDLATRTRAGKLTLDDMSGGTFTVNNTGSFGSVQSTPIINAPQAAIMSVESIVKRPVVINDMIAVRSMVNLCLSLDHRVLDGLVCGRFLQSVKTKLEGIGPETKIY